MEGIIQFKPLEDWFRQEDMWIVFPKWTTDPQYAWDNQYWIKGKWVEDNLPVVGTPSEKGT